MNHRDNQRGYGPPPGMNSYPPPYQHPVNNPHVMLPPYNHQKDNLHGNQSMYEPDAAQMMYIRSVPPNTADMYPHAVRNEYPHPPNAPPMGYPHTASYQPVAQFPYPSHFSNYPPPPLPVQYQSKSLAVTPPAIGKDCNEMKHAQKDQETSPAKTKPEMPEEKEVKKPVPIMVGKRRGGRVLPTGVVKKQRTENQGQGRSDAWSQYMAEVRRYKEKSCEEERKNRPLVK